MKNKGNGRKKKKTRDNIGEKTQSETGRNTGKLGKTGINIGKQEKKHRKKGGNIGKQEKTEGKVEKQGETWENWKTTSPLSSGDMAEVFGDAFQRERDQHSKTRRTGKLLTSYRLRKIRNC